MTLTSLPGLDPTAGTLMDEGRRPDFRDVFGHLARRSTYIDSAVTRVRLPSRAHSLCATVRISE